LDEIANVNFLYDIVHGEQKARVSNTRPTISEPQHH